MPKHDEKQAIPNEDRSGVVDPQHQKVGRNKPAHVHQPAEAFTSVINSTARNTNAVEATVDLVREIVSRLRAMPLTEEAREELAVDLEHNAEAIGTAIVANTDAEGTTRVVGRNRAVNR